MNLNETLTLIAAQIRTDAQILIDFASEDPLGGFHIDESKRAFPMGSLWREEGVILYALVRWLKPDVVAEIGGWVGASASHMALACKANGKGHVISVDNRSEGRSDHGGLIPLELQKYVTLVNDDGRIWLAKQDPKSIGLLFEDADHTSSLVTEIARLALNKIEPGGLLVNHDAHHDFAYDGEMNMHPSGVGLQIRDGLAAANVYFKVYRAEPSDCGLAITVVPGARVDKHSEPIETSINNRANIEQMGNANIESASEPPEPLATEDNPIVHVEKKAVPKSQTVTKRGKGSRKPRVQ